MGTLDIVLLILLGLGAVKGYLQGLIVEFFSFLAFFVGLFLALELTLPVANRFFGSSAYFEIIAVCVFIGLFILLSMAIKVGAKALKKVVDFTFFGTLDNLAGGIAGILKWAFIISIVFWVLDSVGFEFVERYADDSLIFPYIVPIGPKIFGWLSEILPFFKDLIDSMEGISRKGNSLVTSNLNS